MVQQRLLGAAVQAQEQCLHQQHRSVTIVPLNSEFIRTLQALKHGYHAQLVMIPERHIERGEIEGCLQGVAEEHVRQGKQRV